MRAKTADVAIKDAGDQHTSQFSVQVSFGIPKRAPDEDAARALDLTYEIVGKVESVIDAVLEKELGRCLR